MTLGRARPVRDSIAGFVAAAVLVTAVVAAEPETPAFAETTTFPDGTELELTITDPVDGAPSIGGAVDLTGTARVGASDREPDTSLIVVYDGSGSTLDPAGGDCGGDLNGDARSDTILDCEIAAIGELARTADELGTVSEVGVTLFELNGRAADVQPASGFQTLTEPGADLNDNGVLDVYEVVETTRYSSLFILSRSRVSKFSSIDAGGVGGGTNYSAGLSSACTTLASTSEPNRVIVFLSDGGANRGSVVDSVLPCAQSATVNTFAVGTNSTCDLNPTNLGSLQDIADLTGGTCTEVVEPSDLPDVLSGSIVPEIVRLELTVNGGPPIDISDAATVPLPSPGPDPFDWSYRVEGLAGPFDELCVTAFAEAGSQSTSATDCVTVIDNQPPVADAGDDLVVTEGAVATIDGSGSIDPDGDPLTYAWSLVSADGPPVLLTSTTDVAATFATLDDGVYELELEVSDGRLHDTDRVTVTVANDEPSVRGLAEPAAEGGIALVTATFTDGGPLDTHEATIDWGDGSLPEPVPISAQGTGWGSLFAGHVYESGGSFTATISVVDDDGGSGTDTSVSVEVRDSLALWANSTDAEPALDWTGGEGRATGTIHSNNDLRVTGAGKHIVGGRTEYVSSITVKGSTEVDPPPVQVDPSNYPIVFDLADYRPGGRAAIDAGSAYVDASSECGSSGTWQPSGPLAPGLYYVDCDVHLTADALTGTVTLAAEGSIQLSGTAAVFDPYIDGLLAIAGGTGDAAIDVSASNSRLLGFLFAGEGGIDLAGSTSEYLCGILGDRIDISGSNTVISASDCVRPRRTTAPPTLVPDLSLEVANSAAEALPGTDVTSAATVRNDGARLLVAGIVGLENLGSLPVGVDGATLTIEALAAGATAWTPLDEPIDLSFAANAADGVSYPGAGDGVTGTTIDPSGLATWAAELQADLPPDTVTRLLDPVQTDAVRVSVEFDVANPTGEPVRRLYRFGTDLAAELRELGSELRDVAVTGAGVDGAAATRTSSSEAALAVVAPGDAVVIPFGAGVPDVDARGVAESTDAYLDRLRALDDTVLTGMAFASATSGIGRIMAPLDTDVSTRVLPIVETALVGPPSAVAGADVTYDVSASNRGSAPAEPLDATGTVDGADVPVDGLAGDLGPAGLDSGSLTTTIPVDRPQGTMPASVDVAWGDANGNEYGPVDRTVATVIGTPPDVSALLSDEVLIDADATGLPSPGDTLRYHLTITNRGSTPTTGVAASLPLDQHVQLIAGSVTGATVASTTPALELEIGTIEGMSSAEITFDAVIDDPVPDGVASITLQGAVVSDDTDAFPTDDPGEHGSDDPTITRLVDTPPSLEVALAERLVTDVDGNGFAGPGDQIGYVALLSNAGLSAASDVTLDVPVHPATTPVAGSLTADGADVVSGSDPNDTSIAVSADALAGLGSIFVEWTVDVVDPLPSDLTEISVQGTADAAEVDPAPTDDPNLPGTSDPTVTPVFVGGSSGSGGTGGTGGPPGATVEQVGPDSGTLVTEPLVITAGGITPPPDTTVESWRLVTYPADGTPDAAIVLADGTGEPPSEVGTFDPTVLGNGTWIVRLEVVDSGGGVGVAETDVIVDGDLKLGRYSVSYLDADVTVGGLPLQVIRTYDTLDRATSGDFGYGWSLDVADFQVSTNGPLGDGGWEQYSCGSAGLIFTNLCFRTSRRHEVTVRWPDGSIERFDFTPTGLSTFWPIGGTAAYTAKAGTTSKLEPVAGDETISWLSDGNISAGFFGLDGVYDPNQFWLVAQDGTRYLLDTAEGLLSSADANGNTLTVSDAGVVSSQGASLLFERDAGGRITSITEPTGATTEYSYDAAGDLVAIVDANDNTTNLTYESGHYLTVVDEPGSGAFRTLNYGPDGRLESITDAEGNTTAVSFDVDARTETTTSPDGRLTEIVAHDERGNPTEIRRVYDGRTEITTLAYDANDQLTAVTDPLGNTWTAEWDDDQNLVSTTDPDGRTRTWTYNELGLPLTETDAAGAVTTYQYDAVGNLTEVVYPDSTAVSAFRSVGVLQAQAGVALEYDSAGNVVAVTDELGRTTTYEYDSAGRLIGEISPAGDSSTYEYDANGRLLAWTDGEGATTEWTYDARGNVTAVVDPLDRVTEWVYDDRDRATALVDPAGETWTWTYDDNGNVLSASDPLGNTDAWEYAFDRLVRATAADGGVSTYTYDGMGRVVASTDPLGAESRYGYDAAGRWVRAEHPVGDGDVAVESVALDGSGRATSLVDAAGAEWSIGHDPAGRVASIIDPLEGTTTAEYDARGRVTSWTDPLGRTTEYSYDAADQLTMMTDAAGERWTWTYDPSGRLATETDPLGRTFGYDYDGRSLLTDRTDPLGRTAEWTWDAAGQLTGHTSAAGVAETYGYDARGLLESHTDELGHTTSYGYDAAARYVSTTNPRGNTTSWTLDPVGRVLETLDPLGGATTSTYDLAGQELSFTDANGGLRSYSYDDAGNRVSMSDPLGVTTTGVFDAADRLVSVTDARGVTVDYEHDLLGRLIRESSPDGEIVRGYDAASQLTEVTDPTGTTTFAYDPMGRVVDESGPAGVLAFAYDASGDRISMTQPHGTVTYGYDGAGLLSSITDWDGRTTALDFDADGRMTAIDRPGGVTTTHGYDAAGRLESIVHSAPDGLIERYDYALDANGNRTSATVVTPVATRSETYGYDALDRLTTVDYGDSVSETHTYDAAGNRTTTATVGGVAPGSTTYAYDAAQRLTAVAGPQGSRSLSYDAAGNLVDDGAGSTFTWDTYGRLAATDGATGSHTYGYDGTGVRTFVDGVAHLYDRVGGMPLLAETADGDAFLHAAGRPLTEYADDEPVALLLDGLGSARTRLDAAGAPVGTSSFTADGAPRSVAGEQGHFGYAGHERDPSGLIFARARVYDPEVARFLTRDPYQPNLDGTQGWNWYSYVGANPTTFVDPTGFVASVEYGSLTSRISAAAAAGLRLLGLCIKGILEGVAWTLAFAAAGIGGGYTIVDAAIDCVFEPFFNRPRGPDGPSPSVPRHPNKPPDPPGPNPKPDPPGPKPKPNPKGPDGPNPKGPRSPDGPNPKGPRSPDGPNAKSPDAPPTAKDPYQRPSGYRKGVRDEVWERARNESPDGVVRDPKTGRPMSKDEPWDMGHKPGHEFKKHQDSARDRGVSRKEFLDEHNEPSHYRPELPSSNRSHSEELPDDVYFGP